MSTEKMVQIPQHLLEKLAIAPENAPGTHLVNCVLKNRTILGVTVVNRVVAIIEPEQQVTTQDIQDIWF